MRQVNAQAESCALVRKSQKCPESLMQDAHDPYAALRSRDYCLLLSSNVLAATAAEAQFAAVEWELFQRTGLPEYLGYGGLAQFVPVLLLGLPAGHAADRVNRKYLLMAAQAAMLLASVGLALVSHWSGPVWMIELLLAAITLDLFAVLLGGATALLPMFAEKILQVGPIGFGWLRAAEAIGAFGMAMYLAHRPPLKRPGRALLWAVAGFGMG